MKVSGGEGNVADVSVAVMVVWCWLSERLWCVTVP